MKATFQNFLQKYSSFLYRLFDKFIFVKMNNVIDINGEIMISFKNSSILFESNIDKSINYDNDNDNKTLIN
jgi:hypothetical protein